MGIKPFENYETEDYAKIMPDLERFEGLQAKLLAEWLIKKINPLSVIDIGGGSGFYLPPFRDTGAWTLCVDAMECPKKPRINVLYDRRDLREPYYPLFEFDIALCLEVAEHLQPEYADTLIDTLCRCSETVVFSAATPGQGGTNHHNERAAEYWLQKFRDRGYGYHPINGEFRTWLRSLTPLRLKEKVCGWFIDHTFILQKTSGR